jgi:hypothetical protein
MPGLLFRERVRPDVGVEGKIRDANPERVSIANSQARHGWCETTFFRDFNPIPPFFCTAFCLDDLVSHQPLTIVALRGYPLVPR